MADPLAQTFKVDNESSYDISSAGAFATKVDLFFSTKDATQPITIEIREIDPSTDFVTNKVVPFSRVTIASDDVNTSTDASAPTPFIFRSPVYLLNKYSYAIVIKPGGGSPNYRLYSAVIGGTDTLTGNRVNKNPYTGILYASSNDTTWTAVQGEDLKFNIYFANFGYSQTGTLVMKNKDKDFFTIANTSLGFQKAGEIVHGETTLTLYAANTSVAGEVISGNTSTANGTVSYVSGTTIRVKDVSLASKFTTGETVYFATSNTLAVIASQATPTAVVDFYDPTTAANTYLHVSSVSAAFTANNYIKGQTDGETARIVTIDNIKADVLEPYAGKLDLDSTSLSAQAKLATGPSTAGTLKNVTVNDNNQIGTRYVLSYSNESANLSGQKSGEIQFTLKNGSNYRHSPVIDLTRTNLITVDNLINNDATGEAATSGGSADVRYITRRVTLADGQDAEDLKVYITAYKPSTATINVYYKILHGEDSDTFDDVSWVAMTQVTSTTQISDSEATENFIEYEYTIPTANLTGSGGEVQYTNSSGVTLTGFKYFTCKVVLLSSDTSNVPRIRDFRAIALQI